MEDFTTAEQNTSVFRSHGTLRCKIYFFLRYVVLAWVLNNIQKCWFENVRSFETSIWNTSERVPALVQLLFPCGTGNMTVSLIPIYREEAYVFDRRLERLCNIN